MAPRAEERAVFAFRRGRAEPRCRKPSREAATPGAGIMTQLETWGAVHGVNASRWSNPKAPIGN